MGAARKLDFYKLKVGDVFDLRPGDLIVEPPKAPGGNGGRLLGNYRAGAQDDEELRALAESMGRLGQIQRVAVFLAGERFYIAAGFRRVLAIQKYGSEYGIGSIKCELVDGEAADLIRLAENIDRKNPTTFETARYLAELNLGKRGPKRSSATISEAIGFTPRWINQLIQYHRELPAEVLAAWEADTEGRFTASVLTELLRLHQEQQPEKLARRLAVLTGAREVTSRESETAEQEAAEEVTSQQPEAPPERQARPARKLGRTRARKLAEKLGTLGEDKVRADYRAGMVFDLLQIFAGEKESARAEEIINELIRDLGGDPEQKKKGAKNAKAGA